jgi:hypothetical protein
MKAQNQIGWHQLLLGRFAIIWGDIVGVHLARNQVPHLEMTVNRWGKLVICMIFQLVLDIWERRNHEGHVVNVNNESQLSRQRIMAKIVALQESNPEVRYCDRDFVFCPIETIERYLLANLISWHTSARSIIEAQKKYRKPQRSIRDFFPVHVLPVTQILSPAVPPPDPDPVLIQVPIQVPPPSPPPDPDPAHLLVLVPGQVL